MSTWCGVKTRRSLVLRGHGSLLGKAAAATTAAALLISSPHTFAPAVVAAAQSAAGAVNDDPVHAAIKGDVSALEALAAAADSSSSGSNFTSLIRATDSNGWSALHEACRAGQVEAVKFFVERGGDVNARTTGGVGPTPLGIARRFWPEDHPVVTYLTSIGAEDRRYEEGVKVVGADGEVVAAEADNSGLWEAAGGDSSSFGSDESLVPCEDTNRKCEEWAEAGICESNKSLLKICRKSCGVCAEEEEPAASEAGGGGDGKTIVYSPPSPKRCRDNHDRCNEWAERGECENNELYMLKNCKRSCGVCRRSVPCADEHERCGLWADFGECDANPKYMRKRCKKSCGVCLRGERELSVLCVDGHEKCEMWAEAGECVANPTYMLPNCAKSCLECAPDELDMGEAQRLHLDDLVEETREIIDGTESYIRDVVFGDTAKYDREVRKECKNRNQDCSYWAAQGECEANPKYMKLHCAPACRTCEVIDFGHRCPMPENATDALGPGDLNAMFERVADDTGFTAELGLVVNVLSRPMEKAEEEVDEEELAVPSGGNAVVEDRPWVVTMENFVSPEECERLIELGGLRGYERSQDVGKRRFDGTYEGYENEFRTSENAWCHEECNDDPVTRLVMDRIAAVTGIPEKNSEYLQLLRYDKGQFYRTHHDFIGHHVGRPIGPRILTLYLYLNDVEEGGGTDFPDLGLTVMPKRGMALLWPSVLDEDPNKKDGRTEHQALPVDRGIKYGANAWIHLRDYKTPDAEDCA